MTTPSAPQFPKLDPATPEFWDLRFAADVTPWDQRSVPANMRQFVESAQTPRQALIPGCGAGHEVALLAAHGWAVTAIDFSPAGVAAARARLGALASHVHEMDFFGEAVAKLDVDFIYERAFLCALPRRLWPQWATRVAMLLPTGGLLAGYFYMDDSPKGPPFGLAAGELDTLLAGAFIKIEEATPTDSIAIFRGKEKWMVWQRCEERKSKRASERTGA